MPTLPKKWLERMIGGKKPKINRDFNRKRIVL